ncbi:type II secretion system F family protein [Agrococcus sp. SGAir0287]|uniref:type II secretion system F family protein n=1 Tax=Agrococcus sp. SGAir0287 TaxID=2070347 RepID=UPI0010CCB700|nr:type II secretion system F family protein [Agrococcus sp. SGAir0287]QCR18921.1 pilus assembly protein [Agrococcus sp. SGAir0287]
MTGELGLSLVLGATLGLGLWSLVSLVPVLRRPRLLHRVAPYVLDVSAGARDLVARRTVDPTRVVGVVAAPVSDRLSPVVHALLGSPGAVAARLRRARSPLTLERFRARQLVWGLIGAIVGAAVGALALVRGAAPAVPIALLVVTAASGALLADWLLQRAVRRRMARIASELPTVLEFLALSLAAGEGLGDALRRVARIGTGELAGEIAGVVADAASGASLSDALERLATELEHPGVTRCVDQMRGALERGTPLAQTLQAQAQDARDASRRDLLEAAGRKEIAMLVPLVFGLLPTTVAFALWPGFHVLQVGF